ncbi:MAG: DM13 domain-containing protein [Candidatus Competibacterales bacterium]
MSSHLLNVGLSIFLFVIAGCASTSSRAPDSAATFTHLVTGQETARGTFRGESDHVTTGHASVFRSRGQWVISLASDFSLDGAPDPKVGLGNNGYRPESQLGELKQLNGAQVYVLPAGLDIGDYNQVWIWCEQFNVPLGVAELTLL